jgi:hypothetical protein
LPKRPLFPQFRRLHERHRQLDGAGAVHLLAHDRLDLADHAQAHRHVVVDAGTELLDHARAGHELVAGHFRIGGGFLERGNEELGGFHGRKVTGLSSRFCDSRRWHAEKRELVFYVPPVQ